MARFFISIDTSNGRRYASSMSTTDVAKREVPTGTINGTNTIFYVTEKPKSADSCLVFLNGQPLSNDEFTLDIEAKKFTFSTAPQLGQQISIFYIMQSSAGVYRKDEPTGTINGVNTEFYLPDSPKNAESVLVFRDRILLEETDYTVDVPTRKITLNSAPVVGQNLIAHYQTETSSIPLKQETPSGTVNGTNTDFVLSSAPSSSVSVVVFLDGIAQMSSEYTIVTTTTVRFTSPPQTGQRVYAWYETAV